MLFLGTTSGASCDLSASTSVGYQSASSLSTPLHTEYQISCFHGLDLLVLLFFLFLCLILQKGGHGSLVWKISCLSLVNSQVFIKCSSSRNSQTTYKYCYLPFRAGKSKAFLRLEQLLHCREETDVLLPFNEGSVLSNSVE